MGRRGMVSIIIVNLNGLRWLPGCFDSLAKQSYKNYEVIFVDNASTDGSVFWVRRNYPKVTIRVNKSNVGFAEGNNVGYRVAKGGYILFLNNDTRVTPTFLSEFMRVFESDPDIGGAQSKILLMDKPDTHDSVGAFLTPTGFLFHYGFGKKNQPVYDKQINLYTAKGACMMFRKDVLDQVAIDGNIFDPEYFAYFEETDLCHRVWLAGYKIAYAYKSVIYHKMGATSRNLDNAFVQYHSFKNRLATYITNLDTWHVLTIVSLYLLYTQAYAVVLFCRGKFSLCIAIQKGIWWNVLHLPHLIYRRRVVQHRIRKVTDASFWRDVFRTPPMSYYLALSGTAGFSL